MYIYIYIYSKKNFCAFLITNQQFSLHLPLSQITLKSLLCGLITLIKIFKKPRRENCTGLFTFLILPNTGESPVGHSGGEKNRRPHHICEKREGLARERKQETVLFLRGIKHWAVRPNYLFPNLDCPIRNSDFFLCQIFRKS